MGNCTAIYEELRFDVRDPNFLHVYMFIRAEGDCMHTIPGWHHKAFPLPMTSLEVLTAIAEGKEDTSLWEREHPRPVLMPPIFRPWEQVPVMVEHLQNWEASFAAWDWPPAREMAGQVSAYLAVVPKWEEACPYCRALSMLRDGQQPGKSEG